MIGLENISLRMGGKLLWHDARAVIGLRDRIGVVGPNGAGKSTLLKVLAGLESLDAGDVVAAKYVTVGYLPQEGLVLQGRPVVEEVESVFTSVLELQRKVESASTRLETLDSQGDDYLETLELIGAWEHQLEEAEAHKLRARVEKVLAGLGFAAPEMERDCGTFSGGWQMRIALAKLLLQEPTLLLLDEPTNHLDIESQRWLELYLKRFPGAVMVVSHDRSFLDELTNRTFALERGRFEAYAGNYSYFEEERVRRRESLLRAKENQDRQIAKTEEFIDRFRAKATKASLVQSRIKQLEKIERIELNDAGEERIHFRFPEGQRSGQTVIELEAIQKAYGELIVFRGLELKIERGDRIAVVGVNGAGKSTLVKILAGVEPVQGGERRLGHQVALSYFAQHQADELDPQMDVLSTIESVAPAGERSRCRTLLGAFLFRGDEVFKKVAVLSGGEKNRLALAKMLVQQFNCLILDEPTNHLDMRSQEMLQEALAQFGGALIVVSHNRAFLDPVVTKVLEVSPGGKLRWFLGNVSDYVAKVEAERAARPPAQTTPTASDDPEPEGGAWQGDPKMRRKLVAARNKELAPLRREVESIEARIEELEEQKMEQEAKMADPAFFKDGDASKAGVQEYEKVKTALDSAFAKWEELTEKVSRLEAAPLEQFLGKG